ncbi:alpha/beta hydrolase [Nostoc sp. UCD121]|uniref:alpha/beta hydrolase n=1 Tax=unclassified Nostoc TaxID=2593658 RepID=UPI001627F835|nr:MULTISPECIES: alpha/beta hydrolase [unclassified Nostoc]MBC1218859.1 alpha/beta hydrolase [Nostoc sp. UCD120]MBC1275688.1 alpha/beta hydrolase [Nostoc sp. UCD121]MBC1296270.1 alpha/beta hydrolase [Nostoc sp. UCD122]
MFPKPQIVFSWLVLLLSFTSLFLSSWILLPAPNMSLLTLAVGAPEVSPWLLLLNSFSLLLSFFCIRRYKIRRLSCIFSSIGLLLCVWVLANIPLTQMQMDKAMKQGLGTDYLEQIPVQVRAKMQTHPFDLVNSFRGIALGKIRYQKDILFASPAGVPLKMEVYQPPEAGKYPAVVVIYGGAWQYGNPHANSEFNQYIAYQGYTVFAIDYRHAPKYQFPTQLDDVRTALNFIRKNAASYEADPERMVLIGRSAGAHLAMLAAYQPDAPPIRAVINYYGPVNLPEGYKTPPVPDPINTRAVLKAFLGGSLEELPNQYKIASPINYLTHPLPPTLLIYGSRDHLVEARFGRQMYESLHNSGNTAVFLQIPWAEHAFDAVFNGVSNQLALYHTERFLAWALFKQ